MNSPPDLTALRRDYSSQGLHEEALLANPLAQLQAWLTEALNADLLDATALCLATASSGGTPSVRVVLLKSLDAQGLTFFTRYSSRKGHELLTNPQVSLLFHWREFNRQVRVEGMAARTSREESWAYFQTRPRASRVAARVSCAHTDVADRASLERLFAEEDATHSGSDVAMPDDWGGYRVTPVEFEFWQGRENRLHDRVVYRPGGAEGRWVKSRLLP